MRLRFTSSTLGGHETCIFWRSFFFVRQVRHYLPALSAKLNTGKLIPATAVGIVEHEDIARASPGEDGGNQRRYPTIIGASVLSEDAGEAVHGVMNSLSVQDVALQHRHL